MKSKVLQTVGLAMLVCLLAAPVWAGGLIMYEVDSPSTGTASAGWAALAKDAATAFQNPAGMTRLDRSQLLAGVQPLIISSDFKSSPGTRVMGGGEAAAMRAGFCPRRPAIMSTVPPTTSGWASAPFPILALGSQLRRQLGGPLPG